PARGPGAPLRVALVGGANAWLDVDTIVAALDQARRQQSELEVLLAGGPIPGHFDEGWERLSTWAAQTRGVALAPRLPPDDLRRALATCHVGLVLDRPGLEPETGSRTRVLFLLHQGLEVVTTPCTELCADLAARDLVHAVPVADPGAVAATLARLRAGPTGERPRRAARELPATLAPAVACAAVVAFCQRPTRGPPASDALLELARENARLREELAAVYATTTWRALARLDRALRGRRHPR
ncbi:hypothetical protein L6R53_29860, partial [Myxococcota bacterium]|nr:hypothetical protein [Myxococcota bacterium]